MTTEDNNKSLVRRFVTEIFGNRNLTALDDLLSPDYVDHYLPADLLSGVEANRLYFTGLFHAFPDLEYVIEDLVAVGDRVICREVIHATHGGDYHGIPATGRSVRVTGICILRVVDGRLVEHWHETDRLGLLRQLGVLSPL